MQTDKSRIQDYLKRVRSRVEQGWCKGVFAVDSQKRSADIYSDDAVQWCMLGAMEREIADTPVYWAHECDQLVLQFIPEQHRKGFDVFNDAPETTKEDVLKVLDKAIASLS